MKRLLRWFRFGRHRIRVGKPNPRAVVRNEPSFQAGKVKL